MMSPYLATAILGVISYGGYNTGRAIVWAGHKAEQGVVKLVKHQGKPKPKQPKAASQASKPEAY